MRATFDNLRTGSAARLKAYKLKAAQSLRTIAQHHGTDSPLYRDALAQQWRRERWVTHHGMGFNVPHGYSVTRAPAYGGVIYADSDALDHLREVRSDDKTRDYGRGWYTDADCCETIAGRVALLTARNGESRFIAYAVPTGSDGITIDASVYDDARAACHAADRLAERIAEDEREYSEKWSEARELDDENENARVRLQELRERVRNQCAAIRALRVSNDSKAAGYHERYLREALEEMEEKREGIRTRAARLAELRADGVDC